MLQKFSYSQFQFYYPDDFACLEEIKKLRFSKGIRCKKCKDITAHYKLSGRTAYSCKYCRNQVFPLSGTIFEKSATPLRLWLYAMFLMTHSRSHISIKQLQKELRVTYKTAWRMYHLILSLMKQNNGDLLTKSSMYMKTDSEESGKHKVRRWILFNTFEIKVVHRQESSS